ncbi:hypothetical protein [Paenibacillus kobensis]|uniref:hypothetical protein n=1 Tax=Paenibacillus kobensis TaxID=59841 RepID=UPI000FD9AEE0|nr:hypothetical protein [Paenibacillus kobensis]
MKKKAAALVLAGALLGAFGATALAGTNIGFSFYGKPSSAGDIRIIDNRAYVPIREFSQAIGGKATFDNATKTLDYEPVDLDALPPALSKYMKSYLVKDWAGVTDSIADDGVFINHDNPGGISGKEAGEYLSKVYAGFAQYGESKSNLRAAYVVPDGRILGIWEITAGGHLMATGAGFYTPDDKNPEKLKRVELFQLSASPDEFLIEDHSAAAKALEERK